MIPLMTSGSGLIVFSQSTSSQVSDASRRSSTYFANPDPRSTWGMPSNPARFRFAMPNPGGSVNSFRSSRSRRPRIGVSTVRQRALYPALTARCTRSSVTVRSLYTYSWNHRGASAAAATSSRGFVEIVERRRGGEDRHRHALPEDDGPRVALRDVGQDARPQRPLVVRLAVPTKGDLVLGASRDVVERRARNLLSSYRLEFEEVRERDGHAVRDGPPRLIDCAGEVLCGLRHSRTRWWPRRRRRSRR